MIMNSSPYQQHNHSRENTQQAFYRHAETRSASSDRPQASPAGPRWTGVIIISDHYPNTNNHVCNIFDTYTKIYQHWPPVSSPASKCPSLEMLLLWFTGPLHWLTGSLAQAEDECGECCCRRPFPSKANIHMNPIMSDGIGDVGDGGDDGDETSSEFLIQARPLQLHSQLQQVKLLKH